MARSTLRAVVVVSLGVLPVLVAASGAAAPGAQQGPAPPQTAAPLVNLPARIVSFKRVGPRDPAVVPKYVEGPIHYEIEVAAPTTTDLSTNLLMKNWKTGLNASVPVSVKANARGKVSWRDDAGLLSSCEMSGFNVSLESVPGSTKNVEITPNCTFTTSAIDPTAPIPPDTKAAQRANKVYYTGPQFSLACVDKPGGKRLEAKMSAAVVNKSNLNATNVTLKIDGPRNATSTNVGQLAPNESKPSEVEWLKALSGEYVLSVAASGPSTYQPGWRVKVGISCALDVDLK